VQAFSPPTWTHRYSILFVIRSKREQPATVQAIRFDDYLLVTAAGGRSFGGPLDLGPVDEAMREAGWGVEHKSINHRKEYRSQIPWTERDRVAVLMACTLELLGATDPGGVVVQTYVDG
jgi:hypothetical protein